MRFYSQNGEDCLLWSFFGSRRSGFFVDVGAFDGIHLSNSYSFEENGWRGICVEAHPDYFPLLKRNRPNSVCLHVACVSQRARKTVTFQVEKMGLLSSVVDSDKFVDDVKARYAARGLAFEGFHPVEVPAATLDEILEQHHDPHVPIDFVSIDVEGLESEVLRGFDASLYAPRLLLAEANTDEAGAEIVELLTVSMGYLYAGRLAENLFFVRTHEDLARIRDIAIDCRIEKQSHPLGDEYSTPKYLRGKVIDRTKWNRLIW